MPHPCLVNPSGVWVEEWSFEPLSCPSLCQSDRSVSCDLWHLTFDGKAVNVVRKAGWRTLFRGLGPGLGQSYANPMPPPDTHTQTMDSLVSQSDIRSFGLQYLTYLCVAQRQNVHQRAILVFLFVMKQDRSHTSLWKHRRYDRYGTCVSELVCVCMCLRLGVKLRGSSLDRETANSRKCSNSG